MIYEKKDYWRYGSNTDRFQGLAYMEGDQELVKGRLPETHGISYLYAREQKKKELKMVMGLDYLAAHPEKTYEECMKEMKVR
jgi:hypothetical protein